MGFPQTVQTVNLTFGPILDAAGKPLSGKTVRATLSQTIRMIGSGAILSSVVTEKTDSNGIATLELLATDSSGVNVTGFTYKLYAPDWHTAEINVALPKAAPAVHVEDLIPVTANNGTVVYTVLADTAVAELITNPASQTRAQLNTLIGSGGGGGGSAYIVPSGGDDSPAFQAAIDAGMPIDLKPDATYFVNTPVFIDQASAFQRVVINGRGATIQLGAALPTTNWGPSSTTRFWLFPNTMRTAHVAGVVTVNDANRATGTSTGALRSLIVRDLTVDGGAAYRGFCFANRTGCTFENVTFWGGRALLTWWDYSDGSRLASCYSRNATGGPAEQVLVEQYQQGDGLIVTNCKADSNVAIAHLTTCRGAEFSGTVTGKVTFKNCSGINFVAGHQEGQQSTVTSVDIENSHVTMSGTIIYENWSDTVAPIRITDASDESDTELVLDNCQVVQLHTTATGNTPFSPLIEIASVGETTSIKATNLRAMFASSAMSGKHPWGVAPYVKAPTAVQSAFDAPAGRAALARGTWEMHRLGSGVWTVTDGTPSGAILTARELTNPSIIQITNDSGVNSGGTLANGTAYEYAFVVRDALGRRGPISGTATGTAGVKGALRLLLGLGNSPSYVEVWRKAGTGVLSAPTHYVQLGLQAARTYVLDTGDFIGGRRWETIGIPVPNTVAATNATQNGINFPGAVITVADGIIKLNDLPVGGGLLVVKWVSGAWQTANLPLTRPAGVQCIFWLSPTNAGATTPPGTYSAEGDIWFRHKDAAPL